MNNIGVVLYCIIFVLGNFVAYLSGKMDGRKELLDEAKSLLEKIQSEKSDNLVD